MKILNQIGSLIRNSPLFTKKEKVSFNDLFVHFHQILEGNNATMEMVADMEDKLGGQYVFDKKYMEDSVADIEKSVLKSAYNLNFISGNKDLELYNVIERLARQLKQELAGELVIPDGRNVLALEDLEETLDEAVGNKAYNLFKILNSPRTNVPPGFVVTIGGFHRYFAMNNLHEPIKNLMEECRSNEAVLDVISNKIRLLILNGEIPTDLRHEILKAAEAISPAGNGKSACYSVRSSAVGEDGALSFAGLHDSFLNVPFRELLSSYKKVLAGMYTPGSIRYRIEKKIPFTDMAMAVLFQQMVDSQVAGVVYTVDPNAPQNHSCMIGAGWGLGTSVVEGNTKVDMFQVSRRRPYEVLNSKINKKKWMLPASGSGKPVRVSKKRETMPCLSPEQVAVIVETALIIERFFKHPMDIEWALDDQNKLRILQARHLGISRGGQARSPELKALLKKQTVLLNHQGIIAYQGVGAGPVYQVTDEESLDRFPSGAVLLARFGIPMLSRAIPRASAIITDVGSPTGHMATVAREFQIPTIVDTGSATQILESGQEVTVDAEKNIVYQGRITDLLFHQLLERPLFEFRYEFQILRRLLRRISPLTLIDPEGTNFNPKGCTTFHDVIRYIHETSLQTLLTIAENPADLSRSGGKRLKSSLPLNMILIDIGGGLDNAIEKARWVIPEQILSRPMKALWAGMDSPDAWNTDPIPPDFKGLMSGLTRTQTQSVAGQTLAGLNVAVLGADYLNLTLRVGYHFTVVDAYLGSSPEKNSIFFRFVGGATDISRRSRRALLLLSILENIGFKVEGSGDLVIARAVNSNADQIKNYLYLLGRLIGFVRQLDILMKDDTTVELYFNMFMAANSISPARDLTF